MMPGKSLRTEWVARYAIESGRNTLLATTNPAEWYRRLRELFPDAKLKQTEHGVIINPKTE